MPTAQKTAIVAELTEKMSRMQFALIADYRGMNVEEISKLRAQLRQSGAEFIVAKNTLLRIAARATGNEAIEPLLEGPTAIAFVYQDIAKTAKTFSDYLHTSQKITIRGGLLGKSLLNADALEQVKSMPSREQLIAQLLGAVQAPVSGLIGLLNAPASDMVGILNTVISDVAYVVQARIDQLQSAGEAA